MGCRTRVMSNIHGEETAIGRGNLSFTSINLVKLALINDSKEGFFKSLNHYIKLGIRQLLERYSYQCTKSKRFSIPIFTRDLAQWRKTTTRRLSY